ncbi:SLC13 family permease [Kangiella sediminilitoris]|uniref:TrkA-C domain protein n=1 Tax=Kangiella sediminilitoris TaxID=1144748 RepID=A0A1B3BBI5_9GAMM|nr:SLC13 family permease [Kangiella sediminilitoris]AOE50153.1 TrkA-C domain protein [Kangiella sediminilitoris]
MDLAQLYTLAVILAMLGGLIMNVARPAWLFSLAALALYFPGFVSPERMFSHAVNPAVLTLVLLLVSSLALEKTRVLAWISRHLFSKSQLLTLFKMGGLVAISSAFLNNTAVVASLISSVRHSRRHSPKRLLIPLSFFAILGGTLTLIGTSTNLIVNSFLVDYGEPGFNFFDFLPVGICILVVAGLAVVISSYWIPATIIPNEISKEYFLEASVDKDSHIVGLSLQQAGLSSLTGLSLVEIVRENDAVSMPDASEKLQAGDQLIFSGDVTQAKQLANIPGVNVFADSSGLLDKHLKEVIISPNSTLIGRTLKQSSFRAHFDAAVVAVGRNGMRLPASISDLELRSGDKLVLAVGRGFYQRPNIERNFILLDKKDLQPPLAKQKEWLVFGGFISVIGLAATGVLSLLTGLLLYLMAMFTAKVLTPTEVRRRLPLEIWLVISAALAIADVFNQVGAAQLLSSLVESILSVESANDYAGIYWAFIICYLLTWLITEVVTNNAAAALMFPLAFGIAESLGVSYMPFAMAVAYGASASFISPFGYQTNLMVMNAGHMNFSDFAKVGWLVSLCFSAVALIMIPIVFPFNP